MLTTIYNGSKGPVDIATMAGPHAASAAAKLRRTEPTRVDEITALEAHAASEAAKGQVEPAAQIGDNGGPPLEASALPDWPAIKTALDDTLSEARNWADGVHIASQEQADAVARLRDELRKIAKAADAARIAEKAPLDAQIAAIQDRYNAYLAPATNRKPGEVTKAVSALGNLLTDWLKRLDDERREREREAAAEAARAAAEALAARADAKASGDLHVLDDADDKLAVAEALLKQAKGVAAEKVQAKGTDRATGLRSFWVAEMAPGGGTDALRHYLKIKPERVRAFLQSLADEDVRGGARAIPGFTVRERRKVA